MNVSTHSHTVLRSLFTHCRRAISVASCKSTPIPIEINDNSKTTDNPTTALLNLRPPDNCCGQGCNNCVWLQYVDELAKVKCDQVFLTLSSLKCFHLKEKNKRTNTKRTTKQRRRSCHAFVCRHGITHKTKSM